MDWIDNFTAIIQLMCAVNFGYIATSYPEKLYKIFFDYKRLVSKPYRKTINKNEIIVNYQSSKELDTEDSLYIVTKKEFEIFKKKSQEFIEKKEAWEKKRCQLKKEINKKKKANGVNDFFLFISIYSVMEMILIALIQSTKYSFFLIFLVILNIEVLEYSFYLLASIWKSKMDKKSNCYTAIIYVYMTFIIAAIIFTFIYLKIFEHTDYFTLSAMSINICLSGCVILPFIPMLSTTFHVWFFIQKKSKEVEKSLSELKKKEKELKEISKKANKNIIIEIENS